MTTSAVPPGAPHFLGSSIEQALLEEHGELMTGASLRRLLHMGHERAFRRALTAGRLPVSVFQLPGRKGWFARTRDVAHWLACVGAAAKADGQGTMEPERDR